MKQHFMAFYEGDHEHRSTILGVANKAKRDQMLEETKRKVLRVLFVLVDEDELVFLERLGESDPGEAIECIKDEIDDNPLTWVMN